MPVDGYKEALKRIKKAARENADGLDLDSLDLNQIPTELFKLVNLEWLYLSNNQLTAIPDALSKLTNLADLYLANNQITVIPDTLGNLQKLKRLDLAGNQITVIADALGELTNLSALFLHGNRGLGLPVEVLGPTKLEALSTAPAKPSEILEYYFRTKRTERPLNEAKLILVGRGAVGKTSLARRLIFDKFDPKEKMTEGINIDRWQVPIDGEEIRLNVWDFGGQEIMHATHQFFLTERSVYLLVLNGRDGGEDADAEYWLKLIGSFGGNSPVIIVLNKINEHAFDLNRNALVKKYPNIKGFVRTDCGDGTGIQELKQAIFKETGELDELHVNFPGEWFAVKDLLASARDNYIGFAKYRELCAENGITDPKDQELLARFLNQLGIVLNYKDDPRLRDTHVLNPHWLTEGIYKILNSKQLEENHGEIRLDEASGVLPEKAYPTEMVRFIFDLMKKFDLCFSFPDNDRHYLIPELLPKNEPNDAESFEPEKCLNFQFHYPVFPEGILPRFITRTHHLSEGEPRWRSGVILRFEGCRALVRADGVDKKVTISVTGENAESRRRLLAVIRTDFERIHSDMKNLDPAEMVPLPGFPDDLIPYNDILVMEKRGIANFPKVLGTAVKNYKISDLLSGVDISSLLNEEETGGRKLFYSYSRKDESLKRELETHLKILRRQGIIRDWNDREIGAGEDWEKEIMKDLERADIILLLISADFIASDFCYEIELKRALERHRNREAITIPIIIRDCPWRKSDFAELRVIPKGGMAVNLWESRDAAWKNVSEEIEKALSQFTREFEVAESNLNIARISIRNIRCYEDISLSFEKSDLISNFILFFGDNGTGKSTLLKSLALGLCDSNTVTAFMETQPIPLLRHDQEEGEICIDFVSPVSKRKWTVRTIFTRNDKNEITVSQKIPDDFPRSELFACAYGASRRGFGTQTPSEYSLGGSLGTLFDYELSLQNPELAFRRMESDGIEIRSILQEIDSILTLDPGSTILDSTGIQISGPWGKFMPVGGLGDGFQATLGWIADMLGWAMFHPSVNIEDGISGIIIIDELEQHLHPSWQREIVRLLHERFPKIQFIASSHSPMCALGLTGLPEDKSASLFHLGQSDSAITIYESELPTGQRADQLLTSPLFGLFSASSFDLSADIEEFTSLSARHTLTDREELQKKKLREKLQSAFGPYRSNLEEKIDKAVSATMRDELANMMESGELSAESLSFNIRKRLRNIFKEK